ncbi:MAG: NADP-specific glutamate dehydrogenase [Rhodothermales bacterium]|nr:NADP-specific glutamate dehydrogenase [Rhodothermales bacterium]
MEIVAMAPLELDTFMEGVRRRNPHEPEFQQAVAEVAEKVIPYIQQHPHYADAAILERMTEPDRVLSFRVAWQDDQGRVRVNRGYRVQFNNAIGPYKGGLRFDRSVSLSVLKFLGFEQVFKNSLTTLPMGGAKGGADFNPRGKSDSEVMRFCQALMSELFRHIGKNTDVPAGDIGVGAREIGYLFGQYKRLRNEFTGAMTGKGVSFGGSLIRTEATGYGCVYFAREMLRRRGEDLAGRVALISGSGNVAQYAAEKLIELGARVVTMSDRGGFLYREAGLTQEELEAVMRQKTEQRGTLEALCEERGWTFYAGERPWGVPCQMAFPCATQNELDADDARTLLQQGCELVCEGANMPATTEAAHLFEETGILYAPGKAANAGGVAISGLEMTQNSMRLSWSREEVDERLQGIMRRIHEKCVAYGEEGTVSTHAAGTNGKPGVNYVKGANVAGFVKVADAMLAYGIL